MNKIDEQIRKALQAEDEELLEHLPAEVPLHEMVIELFRGRHRWLNILMYVMSWIVFALLFVVGRQFFQAESTKELIGWSTGFLVGVMWLVMMKIWFWLELQKNNMIREIKRLELQFANLSRSVGSSKKEPQDES